MSHFQANHSKVHMVAYEKQLHKKQDYAVVGSIEGFNGFDYLMLFDGHGIDICIEHIRAMDMNSIIQTEEPMKVISDALAKDNCYNSGSTCVIVKIYKSHISIEYVGDSQVAVIIDGVCSYINEPHTLENREEYDRVKPY